MPRKLLNRLLDLFPHFLSKSSDSNFYKSQSVTSEHFRDLYQSLRDTYDSFHLDKKCLIFKEQNEDYDYVMHFICGVPLLENVKIFMDDELIFEARFELSSDESYSFMVEEDIHSLETVFDDDGVPYIHHDIHTNTHTVDDGITGINYSYNHTSENIIPETKYYITCTTFDEYSIAKGFPENDNIMGDIYDHDISLDEIGAVTDIPRKKYILTTDYANTEPPYNNRVTEDDYHYMNRILMYNLMIHETPLAVAEIFKMYGLSAELLNRDRFLVRMFDIFQHPHHYDDILAGDKLLVDDWVPEKWEHKDKLCDGSPDLGEFFFVDANTTQPVKKQKVYFYFDFMNSLAEPLNGDYTVDIFLNGTLIEEDYSESQYPVPLGLLSDVDDNYFTFIGKSGDRIINSFDITIHVRGCDDANFFVQANGSDNNDGLTRNTAFKTLEKAVESVNGIYNLIAVIGTIETQGEIPVPESCILIGCGNAKLTNTQSHVFFNVDQAQYLIVQDITFEVTEEPFTSTVENDVFTNENIMNDVETVLNYSMNNGVLLTDLEEQTFIKNIKFNTTTGVLTYTEYDASEFRKLSDLTGVICNMHLVSDDDVYYSEYTPVTTEERLLNLPFVYLEDRKGLKEAIEFLRYDNTTGILTQTICGDEIIWQAKSHSV